MSAASILEKAKKLASLNGHIDVSKLPEFVAAGAPLIGQKFDSVWECQYAVQNAIGLVCPFTQMTLTTIDDGLCTVAQKIQWSPALTNLAGLALYAVMGRRSKSVDGDILVTESDVEELTKAIHEAELEEISEATDGARPKALLTTISTVIAVVKLLIEIFNFFRAHTQS